LNYYSQGYEISFGGGRKNIRKLLRIFETEGVVTMSDVGITGLLYGEFKIMGMSVNAKETPGLVDECCIFFSG
jgi:hypothetical protein